MKDPYGGLTHLSWKRHRNPRPDIDHTVERYMVYRLHDAAGTPVYIGRSCNVPGRIRAHYANAQSSNPEIRERAAWIFDVRRVSMVGPFTWKEAVRVERAEIEAHRPRGNRALTRAHGWRPKSEGGGRLLPLPSP
jgi:GIY-YIG catalytic domain